MKFKHSDSLVVNNQLRGFIRSSHWLRFRDCCKSYANSNRIILLYSSLSLTHPNHAQSRLLSRDFDRYSKLADDLDADPGINTLLYLLLAYSEFSFCRWR